MKKIIKEIIYLLESILEIFPGTFGNYLRSKYFSIHFKKFGDKSTIGRYVEILAPKSISMGNNCSIGSFSFLSAEGGEIEIGNSVSFNRNIHLNASIGGKITIDDFCLIAPNVVMRTANHNYFDLNIPIRYQGHTTGYIHIKKDVWIGSNVVILKDVTIGEGSIIAAGSVVNRDIPPFTIAGGVPIRIIKKREGNE